MTMNLIVINEVQRAKFSESPEHMTRIILRKTLKSYLFFIMASPQLNLSTHKKKKMKKTRIHFNSLLKVVCTQLHRLLHGILQSEGFHVVFGFHSQVGDA